jgi:hypothetical protein
VPELSQQQPPPPLTPPHRKSGLPDLRTIIRNPGKPGLRGEGNRPRRVAPLRVYSSGTSTSVPGVVSAERQRKAREPNDRVQGLPTLGTVIAQR